METNKNKDWRKSWKEQLDNFSVTPPPEVWEELSEEIAPRVTVGRRVVLWAAAACIAILVGTIIGLQYLPSGIPAQETPLQAHRTEPTPTLRPETSSTVAEVTAEEKTIYAQNHTHTNLGGKANTSSTLQNTPVTAARTRTEAEPTIGKIVEPERTNNQTQMSEPTDPNKQGENDSNGNYTHKIDRLNSLPNGKDMPPSYRNKKSNSSAKKSWAVGLSLGNNLIAAANNRDGFGNLAPYSLAEMATLPSGKDANNANDMSATPYQHVMLQNINARPKTDVKHHFPISAGIAVQKSLNNRLAIETGIVYTYLASDLTAGDAAYYTQKQELHYLGIPLKLNWNFLQKRYFNLYLTGGGMMEKCVFGKLSTHYETSAHPSFSERDKLHVNPLQWSVSAAAGISFKLARHINLYAEPGVVYYFDDGSDISTIRKEKPFNINLQAGLRFDF